MEQAPVFSVVNVQELLIFLADEDKKEFILDAPLTEPRIVLGALEKLGLEYRLREFSENSPKLCILRKIPAKKAVKDGAGLSARVIFLEQHVELMRTQIKEMQRSIKELGAPAFAPFTLNPNGASTSFSQVLGTEARYG